MATKQIVSGTQNDSTTSLDIGILAFGTSVSVTDEVRSSIEKEVEKLEESIKRLKQDFKTEEKIDEELRRSHGSCLKEARAVLQGSTDNLDVFITTDQILEALIKTFRSEFLEAGNGEGRNGSSMAVQIEDNKTEFDENLPPTVQELRKEGLSHQEDLKALQQTGATSSIELGSIQLHNKRINVALADISQTLDTLKEREKSLDEKIEEASSEKNSRTKRHNSLQANIAASQERIAAFEEERNKKLTEWKQNEARLQSDYAELDSYRAAMGKEEASKSALLKNLRQTIGSGTERISKLQNHVQEAQNLISIRKEKKSMREEARTERLSILTQKKELEIELAKLKEESEKANGSSIKYGKEMEIVKQLRQKNDEDQALHVLPGNIELKNLEQQRDKLHLLLQSMQNDPKISDLRQNISRSQQELEEIQSNCFDYSKELDGIKKTGRELVDTLATRKKIAFGGFNAREKEYAELESEIHRLESSNEGKESQIERLSEKLESRNLKQHLLTVRAAAKKLKSTNKDQKKILDISCERFDVDEEYEDEA